MRSRVAVAEEPAAASRSTSSLLPEPDSGGGMAPQEGGAAVGVEGNGGEFLPRGDPGGEWDLSGLDEGGAFRMASSAGARSCARGRMSACGKGTHSGAHLPILVVNILQTQSSPSRTTWIRLHLEHLRDAQLASRSIRFSNAKQHASRALLGPWRGRPPAAAGAA